MSPEQRKSGSAESLKNVEPSETIHHEGGRKKRKTPHSVGELNLTSMLDVCFQLLIFFVVTATFATGEGILPADLPTGESPVEAEDTELPDQPLDIMLQSRGGADVAIVVGSGAGGRSKVVGSFDDLAVLLKRYQLNASNPTGYFKPDDPIVLKPDDTVYWGHVVNAFNSALRAEYTNVNFSKPGG